MSTLTVTGTIGPGIDVTALVISNVARFTVDPVRGTLTVFDTADTPTIFDISAATTFTVSISGSNYTITIS